MSLHRVYLIPPPAPNAAGVSIVSDPVGGGSGTGVLRYKETFNETNLILP